MARKDRGARRVELGMTTVAPVRPGATCAATWRRRWRWRAGRAVLNARGTAPHVWALTGTLVVTVSGDLTRAELIDVAGSLAP